MILLRSFLSGHIRIKRTLEYYDAGIGPRVPFGGGFGPTVSANFAVALGDFTTLSSTSTMPTGGSISRAGNAMLYDSTGKLTYAPNNLLLQSNTFSAGAWGGAGYSTPTSGFSDPFGGSNAWRLQSTSAGSWGLAQNLAIVQPNVMITCWVKSNTGSNQQFRLYVGGVNFSANFTATTSWQQFTFVGAQTVSGYSEGLAYATGAVSNVDLLIYGATVSLVTYETTPRAADANPNSSGVPQPTTTSAYYGPRFDYDPVTLQPKGLLVEGQLQQLLSWSEDFRDTAAAGSTRPWTYSAVSVSPNVSATTAPDGTNNADKIIATSATSSHLIFQNITSSSGTYTASIYLKAAEYGRGQLYLNDGTTGSAGATFNLSTPSATSFSGGSWANTTVSLTPVSDTWFRLTVTSTQGAGTTISLILAIFNAAGSSSYTGDNVSGIYAFGAQLEARAFPTSYLPTQGGTSPFATRAAETFSLTGYANRLVEAYYIDEETGANYSGNSALSTGTVTISPPTFGWVTSLRAYQNAYAGSISTPSWLSFSATTGTTAGNRTYYDSTGTLTWAPANLILQSQDFATTWTRGNVSSPTVFISAPDNSNTGAKLAASNTGLVVHQVYNIGVALSAGTYIASVYLKKDAYSYGIVNFYDGVDNYCYFNLDNGVPGTAAAGVTTGMQSVGNGWYRCWARKTISAVTGGMSIEFSNADNTPASSAAIGSGVYAWGAQLERVTYQTAPSAYIPTTSAAVYGPRYDYDPSTVPATPRGLLIEEQRANIVTRSQQFEDAVWQNATPNFPTVSANTSDTSAPDGTNTAAKVTAATGGTGSHLRQQVSGTLSGQFATTFFVKNGNSAQSRIRLFDNGLATVGNALINWSGSSIASLTSVTGTADYTSVGNGWYRIWVITASLPSNASLFPSFYPDSSAGTGFVYLWGAQLEAGSFATSYIPSITGATRAPDVAQLTGSALTTAGAATGTAIIETGAFQGAAVQASILASNQSNRRIIYNANSTTSGSYDGTNIISTTISNVTTTTLRQALGWGATTGSIVINNGTLVSGALSLGTNATVYLGATLGGTNQPNTWFRSMALYNQKLPDAILKQKSTPGAPY